MAAELALSLVGVVGTLAGTLTVTALQHRSARSERTERTEQDRRRELVQAVTHLVTALADHRRSMWARERLRPTEADETVYTEARSESHRTRADITAPLVTLSILAPALAHAAGEAARATYALRGAADHDVLNQARTEAARASERLVAAATEQLA